MRKLILLLALLPALSWAASADLSWTHPTSYTDGTMLPLSAITSSDVAFGPCNASKTAIVGTPTVVSITAPANARTVTGLTNGSWCSNQSR